MSTVTVAQGIVPNCYLKANLSESPLRLEPSYPLFHIWIHESYEIIHEMIGQPSNKTMNSFKSIYRIWIHIGNDYMNSYTYDFIYELIILFIVYMNSSNVQFMQGFRIYEWIHRWRKSEICIHSNSPEFMNQISLIWICILNSLVTIKKNSISWVLLFWFQLWNMGHFLFSWFNNTDFCYEVSE